MEAAAYDRLMIRLYRWGFGRLLGKMILLLTTTGRKSGLQHTTPLQYEEVAGAYYVGSERGTQADWVRNILAAPQVEVEMRSRHFIGIAEFVTYLARIAEFLELRLHRRPLIVGRILAMERLSAKPNRKQLEDYAAKIAMVIIRSEGA